MAQFDDVLGKTMKYVFDNMSLTVACQDAHGPGWLNLERYSYWDGPDLRSLKDRRGARGLKWGKVAPRDQTVRADFFGRIVPWWVVGLSTKQALAHIRRQMKKLPEDSGALCIFWTLDLPDDLRERMDIADLARRRNRTVDAGIRQEIATVGLEGPFAVALAWSPDPDIDGVNPDRPSWADKLEDA